MSLISRAASSLVNKLDESRNLPRGKVTKAKKLDDKELSG
jgi:hypothetical protein